LVLPGRKADLARLRFTCVALMPDRKRDLRWNDVPMPDNRA